MDLLYFTTENNEYIIELSKELRTYGFTRFGQYKVSMRFLDFMQISHLDIICNEKQLLDFVEFLYEFSISIGDPRFDLCEVDIGDNIFVFIMVQYDGDDLTEDMPVINMQFFQDTLQGRVCRLNLQMSYSYLDTFMLNIQKVLLDVPYLEDMTMYGAMSTFPEE